MFDFPNPVPPNRTTDRDGFYISYNAVDYALYGGVTTAIVRNIPRNFYVLMGDHREALAACPDLDACLDYFREHRSQWSPTTEEPDRPIDWPATFATGRVTYLDGGAV